MTGPVQLPRRRRASGVPTRQRCRHAGRHGRVVRSRVPTDLEDEETWLRHRIARMRTILRFAKDLRAEAGLRELIADAEERLRRWKPGGRRREFEAAPLPLPARVPAMP
jgi:hypothetical protein